MADQEEDQPGVSADILAQMFACDERTIQNLAKKGIAVRIKHGRYNLALTVHNYVKHLREQAAGRSGKDGTDAVTENALLKREQRIHWEKKNALLDQRLIDRPAAEQIWGGIVRSVRALVQQLPGRIRYALPGLEEEDYARIKETVDEILKDAGAGKLLTDSPPLPQVDAENDPD